MKAFPVLWAIACCQLLTSSAGGAEVPGVEKQVDLWTDSIPKSDRPNPEEDRPRMRVCLPEKSKATGAGIAPSQGPGTEAPREEKLHPYPG